MCVYSNVQHAGNNAAHRAQQNDIRTAVLTKQNMEQEYLGELFKYAYDGEEV